MRSIFNSLTLKGAQYLMDFDEVWCECLLLLKNEPCIGARDPRALRFGKFTKGGDGNLSAYSKLYWGPRTCESWCPFFCTSSSKGDKHKATR